MGKNTIKKGTREEERERRRRKRRMRVYRARFLAALALTGILVLMVLGGVGIFRLIIKRDEREVRETVQETMEIVDEDMGQLDELKEKMKGTEFVLILDAGHGGSDVGTGDASYYEKDINMDIVNEMVPLLEYCGVKVLLTREGDETVALEERSGYANESEADRFVSIHCNYCEDDASVAGLECYYWESSGVGRSYAESIVRAAEESGEIKVRGTRTQDFHVLRETQITAILIETGYISNGEEGRKLMSFDYQKTLAFYLVKGIVEGYLDSVAEPVGM